MDYTYECLKLGNIKQETLNELKEFALSNKYSKNPDFSESSNVAVTEFLKNDIPCIAKVVDEISDLLNPAYFLSGYINILPAFSYITEHTDCVINKNPLTIHRVHIPLITNEKVGFMWNGKQKKRPNFVAQFKEGEIYLYNNVAIHSVINLSQEDRYHLLLRYDSPAIDPYNAPIRQ